MKGINKHTEGSLIRFGNHRYLSQSEESKGKEHSKDGTLRATKGYGLLS